MGISDRWVKSHTTAAIGEIFRYSESISPLENAKLDESGDAKTVFDELGREEEDGIGYFLLHQGYALWWVVTSLGLFFAIMLLVWSSQDPDFELSIEYNPLSLHGFIT